MSDILIDRLDVTLHAIDPMVAAEAADGLADEIRRVLGSLRIADVAPNDQADLAAGTLTVNAPVDAALLRGAIAEFLGEALLSRLTGEAGG